MGRRILIVDDNDAERDVFASFLRFVGGTVLEAADGAEALSVARAHRPDLILLDIRMPVMDGWETMERLRVDADTSVIPVIALTAQQLDPELVRAAGFLAFLEKPIVPYRVLEEVERLVGVLADAADGAPRTR